MMFDESGDIEDNLYSRPSREEVDSLFVSALAEWDKREAQIGDTVPQKWFYNILGVMHPEMANSFERAESARKNFMMLFHGDNGFRIYLLKHRRRYLKTNYAGGYEVLAPDAQTQYAQRQRRSDINKALRDESMILTHVDVELLSSKQKQENADAVAHNAALAKIMHRRKPGFEKKK